MSIDMTWDSSCGRIALEFKDQEQVFNMYHHGDCEESVKNELPYFLPQLQNIDNEIIISVLKEIFADAEFSELYPNAKQLNNADCEDLYLKLLWVAAGDLADRINMDELCNWQNEFLSDLARERRND